MKTRSALRAFLYRLLQAPGITPDDVVDLVEADDDQEEFELENEQIAAAAATLEEQLLPPAVDHDYYWEAYAGGGQYDRTDAGSLKSLGEAVANHYSNWTRVERSTIKAVRGISEEEFDDFLRGWEPVRDLRRAEELAKKKRQQNRERATVLRAEALAMRKSMDTVRPHLSAAGITAIEDKVLALLKEADELERAP